MENVTPQPKTSTGSAVQIVIIFLLVIGAFLLGSLWQKVKLLENGALPGAQGQAGGQGSGKKYTSIDDAMKAMAKAAKADGNKLVSCMNSGTKRSAVEADASEATNLGVNGTPGFFINGRFLGGAYPYEAFKELIDKEIAGKTSNNINDYSDMLQSAAKQDPPSFDPIPKKVDLGSAPVRGNVNAPITIVEFSDFQCPFCERVYPTIEKVLKDYDGKVRLVYKQLPLSIHQYAQQAAEAAECAKDQGKFWEFHDALFQNQNDWTNV